LREKKLKLLRLECFPAAALMDPASRWSNGGRRRRRKRRRRQVRLSEGAKGSQRE